MCRKVCRHTLFVICVSYIQLHLEVDCHIQLVVKCQMWSKNILYSYDIIIIEWMSMARLHQPHFTWESLKHLYVKPTWHIVFYRSFLVNQIQLFVSMHKMSFPFLRIFHFLLFSSIHSLPHTSTVTQHCAFACPKSTRVSILYMVLNTSSTINVT